jgi:hypothetical protein
MAKGGCKTRIFAKKIEILTRELGVEIGIERWGSNAGPLSVVVAMGPVERTVSKSHLVFP